LAAVFHGFASPVLPQIRWASCYETITNFALAFSAVLHGHVGSKSRNARWSGLDQSEFRQMPADFPKAEMSPHLGKYFCGGIEPTRKPAVKLSPMEASNGGCFR